MVKSKVSKVDIMEKFLESMKRRYRKKILREILYQDDADLVSCLKKIGMLKVAHNISKSWDEVEVSTLQKAWNNIYGQTQRLK